MSDVSFQRYGKWASIPDPLYATGRPEQVRARERLIFADIAKKLDLQPEDRVLDIGSGIGTVTIPLSFMVSQVTAVDHPSCVARIKKRAPDENIQVIEGSFFDADIKQSFTKILAYSVLHYLGTPEEVMVFINKAVKLLERHGKMLLGDIPSAGCKARYERTAEGQTYARQWNAAQFVVANTQEEYDMLEPFDRNLPADPSLVTFADDDLLSLVGDIRRAGYHAWLLAQPSLLPFGDWREDILIQRP